MSSIFNSGYLKGLSGPDYEAYVTLVNIAGGIDPYEINLRDCVSDLSLVPDLNVVHITNYLVHTTNSVSMKQMSAYMSTEAYNFFTSGFVQSILFYSVPSDKIVVLGKVKHSQTLSVGTKPLLVWVLLKKNADILGGWCTCKAGHAGFCSHVAALLYAVEFASSKQRSLACTSKANLWLPPSFREVPLSEAKNIDFSSARSKRRKLYDEVDVDDPVVLRKHCGISDDKLASWIHNLKEKGANCAIFRVLPQYCEEFAPKEVINIPKSLTELFHDRFTKLSYSELLEESLKVYPTVKISLEQRILIEKKTRKQSDSILWKGLRAGRITASVIYSVLHTDIENPSITVIKNICYPFSRTFVSYWMKRGKALEHKIRNDYYNEMNSVHEELQVKEAGLHIPLEIPCTGATPDGFVRCKCCGVGILEMKAPKEKYVNKDYIPPQHLYQIQWQLFCVGANVAKYCDYIVYHPEGTTVKRVYPDVKLQEEMFDGALKFFKKVILPELLGRYFSTLSHLKDRNEDLEPDDNLLDIPLYCMCQKPWEEPMVKCAGVNCTFKYFHARCFNLKRVPKKWFCLQCRS
ncbi:Chromatin modification-related protein YNG2 [Frankliniella fusca]|uniref:Chromatin modification-related protein YNG2 n=1 Tax=Frankliniella fusca TaxID=407009 RepID=A0AAE1HIW7_9NEOP|nr:Chromatin modification-related protein YNG2 [Frankliniella fusca]KAK3927555.1 Chromatin modification-related protein YNG2 [Frankliniella fusca]